MNAQLDLVTQLDLLLRLAAGLALGAFVGLERELQHQAAGFRTHALVGLGSALFTVVGIYAFTGPTIDPSRVAAQIVSGIGFLGAGAILRDGGKIRGLTTAASLWTVAAVGMAVGAGMWFVAIGGTVFALVGLEIFDRLQKRVESRNSKDPA